MAVSISKDRCISCGACVILCETSAIRLVKGTAIVDEDKCTECRKCIFKCYMRAISDSGSVPNN